MTAWSFAADAPRASGDEIATPVAALARFLQPETAPLTSYRALRRLTASARGGRMEATVVAWTELDRSGLHYEVISRDGSPMIQARVLIPVLEAEAQAIATGECARAAVTRENYHFTGPANLDEGLLRVGIRPQRENSMALEGAIFLRPQDGELVRVEGRLVKRPSFWTRRVDIVRRYGRVAGVRVPTELASNAQVLMLGPSRFTMTWEYESVNGVSVGTPGARAMATSGK